MQITIIDQKLKSLAATERKITHEILLLIQTLDITKSYRELGYSSLFEYLTKEIGYSEGSAQRRIQSARLMKQVPAVEDKLKSGELNLTQVSLAQTAIRQEEKAKGHKLSDQQKTVILNQLKSKSTFETQKILKENLPSFEVPKPKTLPFGSDKVTVTMEFSDSEWKKVESLLAHFSHSVPDQKLESLLLYWHQQIETKKKKQADRIRQLNSRNTACADVASEEVDGSNSDQSETNSNESDTSNDLYINSLSVMQTGSSKLTGDSLSRSYILPPLRRWKLNQSGIKTPRDEKSNSSISRQNNGKPPTRVKAPSKVHLQIRTQADNQCQYISPIKQRRCESKHIM